MKTAYYISELVKAFYSFIFSHFKQRLKPKFFLAVHNVKLLDSSACQSLFKKFLCHISLRSNVSSLPFFLFYTKLFGYF